MSEFSIGLDVSTTCLGICVLDQNNNVVYSNALSLQKYEHPDKKKPVWEELIKISQMYTISRVCIEAPLFMRGKTSAGTITKLFHFNGWVSAFAFLAFKQYPVYVDLNKARRKHGLSVPGKEVTKENNSKKRVFDFLISKSFNMVEEKTRNGNVRSSSYDISDAAFVCFIGTSKCDEDCLVAL